MRKLAEPAETYSVSSYSEYAKEHEIDIMRRDNYGEIFLNPRLLANMVPIKDDPDRVFAFCLGSLPQLDMYLSGDSSIPVFTTIGTAGVISQCAHLRKRLSKSATPQRRKSF